MTTNGTEQSGLYSKYEVRKDGERVENCFVLEPESDPVAREALWTYATTTDDEQLEMDLKDWLLNTVGSAEEADRNGE